MSPESEQSQDSTSSPETTLVADLPEEISDEPKLKPILETEIPLPLKDPVDEDRLGHRDFDDSRFWRSIPEYRGMSRDQFLDHTFQAKNSVTSIDQLTELIGDLVSNEFMDDVREGMSQAPMSLRISPYILSLIDWHNPYSDPLRTQFVPVASTQQSDHPMVNLDSLHEQGDSPTSGLVHRYPDRVLFLPLDVCPVYCRFCTRSYAIGNETDSVTKVNFKANMERWKESFAYLAARSEIEDVVVSGGDAYILPPKLLRHIGETLLAIPHIRRIRFASKGPAVAPMKILTDDDWTGTLVDLCRQGREAGKEVCLHTHFNSRHEITEISRQAMDRLFTEGVTVRNQSVLIRGVNNTPEEMTRLVRKLSYMNVQPYYVYQHDMVVHVEDMRTTVGTTLELERAVRGRTAGFNTPLFVTDLPGGGGKRDVHSYDHYDPVTGISVYRSPVIDEDKVYLYFDPVHLLPEEGQQRWLNPGEHGPMFDEAIAAAGLEGLQPATARPDDWTPPGSTQSAS